MKRVIRNISDTALWVAVYRADETDRVDAIFKDPYARMLAGERGEQIVKAMQDGRKNSWSFVVRTYLFDAFITEHIHAGFEQVLNLASGLDTRAYRLQLPQELCWIDVDLPEIVSYMDEKMAGKEPACNYERIALDLADMEKRKQFFDELGSRKKKTLIVAEGLVGYLTAQQNGELATDLSASPYFERWVFDLMSPGILPLIKEEMGSLLDDANAPLIFAPEEGENFFAPFGWKHLQSKSKLKTAAALGQLSSEMLYYASFPEPEGTKGSFPWSGVCLLENVK